MAPVPEVRRSRKPRSGLETVALIGIIGLTGLLMVKVGLELFAVPPVQASAGRQPPRTAPRTLPPLPRAPVSIAGAAYVGNPSAAVAVIEHQEYQCPFCGKFARETAPVLKAEFVETGKVRWIVRHFPLTSIHPHAAKAAEAVECAGAQGKWWDMHASLYANQQRLEESSLVARAETLNLDIDKFTRCLGGEMSERLASDVQAGKAAGVSGTPTFFVGIVEGKNHVRVVRRLSGARPVEQFRSAIEAVLKQVAEVR